MGKMIIGLFKGTQKQIPEIKKLTHDTNNRFRKKIETLERNEDKNTRNEEKQTKSL